MADERSSRYALTRPLVLRTALRLFDQGGVAGLSMRRLAAELQVTPRALYRHVADKEDLLRGICGEVLDEIRLGAGMGLTWRKRISFVLGEIRRVFMAHPQVVPLFARIGTSSPPGILRVANGVMGAFRDGGFSAEHSVRSFYVLYNYLLGFVALEASRRSEGPSEPPQMTSVNPEEMPDLAQVAPFLIPFAGDGMNVSDEQFQFGLDLILGGLEGV